MAINQQPDQKQQSTQQGDSLSGSIQTANKGASQGSSQGGAEQRSEGLLPADGQDDGRFEVAEEVSLDQQSDKMRHVGQAPDLGANAGAEAASVDDDPDAAADDVLPDPGKQSDG